MGPSDLFFPTPAALVVSGEAPHFNIITIAWIGMVDTEKVGIGLLKNQYSLALMRRTEAFTVNIPTSRLFREVDYCGIVSGKDTDKWKATGLTPVPTEKTKIPIIQECPLNIECELEREIELDDLVLVVGRFVETHVDEDKVEKEGGRLRIDCEKMDPLVYFAVGNEYWSVGEKQGDAFFSGLKIKEKGKEKKE